ncbi:metallophosphoesterase family protein [Lyngbya confervoides]|uniref:Nuclease SbcCD subunit D n=1 Tax=Lyngbya confervoides BDU141951 TaxID=1574623 RepID=A0ABD4TA77_9CYAN|nr:DNA repair exonuclease [Lyngbya confervoides]MCM1985334.1 DNA repair exonuclease [Lyngbya confervoides BDU141951]
MPRFLHLADVHLGFDKYGTVQRTRDFYEAFNDALTQYAVHPAVDFVLISGDLFEYRQVLPSVLNQAKLCLGRLSEAGIPVFAIEGNHDYRPYGTRTSWLRYLADWDYLILLEPDEEGRLVPWSAETKSGGYFDLDCGVRVIGSQWYGAAAPLAIQTLAQQIDRLPPGPEHTVMMFHHGLEGYVSRYAGALRYQDFLPLREAGIDYLALGHIHRAYSVEDWIYNPGSIEANSIIENQEQNPRGVYWVEIDRSGVTAQLKRTYRQRPIYRLSYRLTAQQTRTEFVNAVNALVQTHAEQGRTQSAIVELKITGNAGFDRFEINLREWQGQLQQCTQALIFLLKYEVTAVEYETYIDQADHLPPRLEIERTIFQDFVAAHAQYRDQAEFFSQGLIDLKHQILSQAPDADLYQFVETLLQPQSPSSQEAPSLISPPEPSS